MPAGTIALTNNSATVTSTGTSFTTELKVNDFLVSTVGGLAYTLGVKSIESNTSLTLMEKYTGPSATGQSWTPVPYGTMAAITAQLAAQVTYAIRGLNLDKANWQKIYSSDPSVTVNLPDLNSFTGPSWGYIADSFNNLGDAAYKNTGTTNGTVAAGNDSRISGALQKSGGTMTGGITMGGSAGIDMSGSNISTINVMSWVSTAAARASLANAGFSQPASTIFDVPGVSRTMRVMCASAVVTMNSSGTGTITFPASFPNICNSVVAINGDRNTAGGNINIIGTAATTGFNFMAENSSSISVRVNYIAVGY